MKINKYALQGLGFLLALGAYYFLATNVERHETVHLLSAFGTAGIGYLLLQKKITSWRTVLGIGLIFRLVFWNYSPLLSPDSYRYLWDGSLQLLGINPFLQSPKAIYMPQLFANATFLFDQMGGLHQQYPSIYPPTSQLLYKWIVYLSGPTISYQLLLLRLHYIALELGLFFVGLQLLRHYRLPLKNIGWYYLNPLVIVELTGNLHGEGVMLFFWGAAVLTLKKKRHFWTGVLLGMAICTKLIPLLTLPLLFVYLRKGHFIKLLLGIIPTIILCWLPFWSIKLPYHYLSTFSLWFNQFEFNASIYYFVRWLGWQLVGYNIIGVWGILAPFVIGSALLYYCIKAQKKIKKGILVPLILILTCYFLLATTVHPWYLISILFFSIFTPYRYATIWTVVAFSSYHAYGLTTVNESPMALGVAYAIVFLAIYFDYQKKDFKASVGN